MIKALCDPKAICKAVRLIVGDDQVTEVRALNATTAKDRWLHTASGYFDNANKLAAAVKTITTAKGIYFIPNPVDAALLARAENRIRKTPKGESTQDSNITHRHWLLVDTDPQRPSGISSTDAEHEASIDRARTIYAHLTQCGWPCPIAADSGNGCHLLYRIDEPTDDDGVIERCLKALAKRFDDDTVTVDQTVFNPARIWKLYGTLACKGDDTKERPHRMSKILTSPEALTIVAPELLQELAGEIPNESRILAPTPGDYAPFDIEAFISRNALDVQGPEPWRGKQGNGSRWLFNKSPMCDHDGDGPYIVCHASGAITAGCHHNSCSWTWKELRQRVEPKQEYKPPVQQPLQEDKPKTEGVTIEDAAVEYLVSLADGKEPLIELGIGDLDYAIGGGVAPGEMVVIAARPSHGKSAVALQCLDTCALAGHSGLIISEEMSASAIGKRAIQYVSETPEEYWRHEAQTVGKQLGEHYAQRKPVYIEVDCRTPQKAAATIEHYADKGVEIVVVDYAQLLAGRGNTRYEQVTEMSMTLRKSAHATGVVLLVLCQLNRQVETESEFKPKMHHLKESGQIEQDADVIVFLVWPHRLDSTNDPGEFQMFVAKNRNRGIMQPAFKCEFKPSRQMFLTESARSMPNYEDSFDEYNTWQ